VAQRHTAGIGLPPEEVRLITPANADWRRRTLYVRSAKGSDRVRVPLIRGARRGAEIVLTGDGEWRRTRLFRAHEQAELSAAIADTRATFEAKGWAR
jgi:hypothetical protein